MSALGGGFDIQLQDAFYGDGVMKTDKGGIVKAKDFFLQAQIIEYTRTGEGASFVHTVLAEGKLFFTYKGQNYRGDKALIDLSTGKMTIWNGCTQSGLYFVGGRVIEIASDGAISITDAYITTSENERSDWSITARSASITKNSIIQAQNATFYFIKLPLFWVPSFSTTLLDHGNDPFRYRFRWGGSEGPRFGISYLFNTGPLKHRALFDYSIHKGLGAGVRSLYRSKESAAQFDCLNYIAQGDGRSWDSARYRLEGCYRDYFPNPNLKVRAMYDKLSDRRMKYEFADHAVSDVRAGLTEATVWREEANWKANINGRVRINPFQTIKQELPLLTFNQRPTPLGRTPLILDNSLSAGYLSYKYAHHTPSVHDFASSRVQLSQRLYTTGLFSHVALTPSIGYTLIQYSRSPQHTSRLQAIGLLGVSAKTRFVHTGTFGQQIAEPYVAETSLTRPSVHADKTYVFDIEDGWTQMNFVRYGIRHGWYLPVTSTGFTPKILSDVYARSFFATHHISGEPYKIWLLSTYDATPKVSFKLDTAWDVHQHRLDHCNMAVRQTISKTLAIALEWRQRSAYSWRKLDSENFIVDAVRSPHRLRHSEMSDSRRTALLSLFWAPTPAFDVDFTSYYGFRHVSPRRYINYEISATTLIRGALRLTFSYYHRPGGPTNGFYVSLTLGPKRESGSSSFRRIGDGTYDIW
jgi:hypothetical protein